MKTALIYTIIGLLAINSLTAQVKIGDNPQNLNPASLLELESTSRALVISRVTDAQMSAISPLRGALVYNTDQNCLHYYDGTAWINICEALDDSFTVSTRDDYMSQLYSNTLDSTVVITTTDNGDGSTNYNFEVGEITGSNIQDFSIEGRDIVNRTIAGDKIASRSVNPLRIFNDGDDLTRQVLLWNGNIAPDGEWQRIAESDLQISEADGVIGNEVVGPFDTTLKLEGSGDEIDPYTLDVSEGGITDFEIATGAVTSDEILNGTIATEDINDDAITTIKILDANVTNTKLDKTNIPLSGFGAAGANVSMGNFQINDLLDPTLDTDAATKNYVDSQVGDISSLADASIYVGDINGEAQEVAISGDATMDNAGVLTIEQDAITTTKILDANVTRAKLENGTDIGQLMQWNGTDWVLIDAPTVSEGDGITITTPNPQEFNVTVTNPVVAMGKVNGDGSAIKVTTGFTTIQNSPDDGSYTVSFAQMDDANYIVQLTVLNSTAGYSIQVTNQTDSSFDVQILNEAGTEENSVWYFTITDFTP